MERLIQLFKDLYTNYKELLLVIVTALATLILNKLLPAICSQFSRFISLVGRKLGGRLAYKNIRETYLNWLVYKTQDLNLTGIIGAGKKPKLEQIFLSLRIVKEHNRFPKKEDAKDAEKTKSFMKIFSILYYECLDSLLLSISSFHHYLFYRSRSQHTENTSRNNFFKPDSLWKIHSIYHREGVDDFIILFTAIVLLYLFPVCIFLNLNIPQTLLFIGSTVWSISTVCSIAVIFLVYYEDKLKFQLVTLIECLTLLIFVTSPIILTYITIQNNIIHGLQSPFSIEQGIALGIIGTIIFFIYIENEFRFRISNRYKSNNPPAKGIGDILSSNNYIAILGKPGSGKSTLSQFLALTFAKEKAGDSKIKKKRYSKDRLGINKWYLPIFIPLKDISKFLVEDSSKEYDNLIIEAFRQKVLPSNIRNVLTDSYIYYMLKNRKCLFLLDGLDEIQESDEFNAVIKEINGIISRFPENKVIVTSRHSGWRGGIGSQFNVFEIEDLNDEEISKFIDSWYNAIEENRTFLENESEGEKNFWKGEATEKANKLKQALSDTRSIRQIAENPLLLSIICFVHYNKTLPKERLRLYEDCSNLLLVQWDQEKGLAVDDTKLTSVRKEEIMQEIAFSFHTGKIGEAFGRKEANSDEIIPIVERKLKEFEMDPKQADSLFQKLIERSGIIITTDNYAKRYSFSHLTFQEFYSAEYIFLNKLDIFQVVLKENENSVDALNGWWREVVLLHCLLIRDPSKIIERLYKDSENDILQQNLQLAVQCLDESVKVTDQKLREKILEQVFFIRAHRSSESKIESLDPRIVPYMVKFAQSPFFYRHVIAEKVSQVKNDEVKFLISKILQLSQSANRHKKLIAVEALNLLAFKFDIYQDIDLEFLNNFLTDLDSNVKKATAKLILDTYPRPLDDTVSKKIFYIIEREFTPNITEFLRSKEFISDYFYLIHDRSDKGSFKSVNESCQILKQLMEASSREILVDFQKNMEKIVIDIFNKDINEYIEEYYYHCFECVLKNLRLMENGKLNEIYKFQLLEASLKGNTNQQVFAIKALSELYGSDTVVIQSVLDKLNAPHSKVRIAALSSLSKLNIEHDQFKNIITYLEYHRKPFSKLRATQKLVTQVLVGRGEIGLNEIELELLNNFFEDRNQNDTNSMSKRPEFYNIDDFLYKNELRRKINDRKSIDETGLFELLSKPDIYLNEAVFDFLLEKKII